MGSVTSSLSGRRSIACLTLASAVFLLTVALSLPVRVSAQHKESAGKAGQDLVARGKYLVAIGGCNDCHTPLKMGAKGPEPDMTRMLSGHPQDMAMPPAKPLDMPWAWVGAATNTAFSGPWGTTFAVNLTSDPETGIGSWDSDLFIKTLRSGKIHTGSRDIMPPMPWQNVAQMTDEDLKAVFAYLSKTPPVKNQPPAYIPPAAGN